jgi:exodeoxyribonuclease III
MPKRTAALSAIAAAGSPDPAPLGAGGGVATEGAGGAKAKRAKKEKPAASPHAGPDPAGMVAGPFLPAASMAAFTASLPARAPGGVKIVCYNVNGLRGAVKEERKAALLAWLEREDPDVLCLQEVKADADAVEKERLAALFPSLPHAFFACGDPALAGFKKGYAGCAVFSKVAPVAASAGIGNAEHDGQGRVATARFAWGTVVSVYAPNSGQKLERLEYRTTKWDPALRAYLEGLKGGGPVIAVGDFNVAHQDCDVEGYLRHRNKVAGFCDGERDGFAALLAAGFKDAWRDANPGVLQYSACGNPLTPTPPRLSLQPPLSCFTARAAYYSTRQVTARAENKGWRVDYALSANCAPVVEVRSAFPGADHLPFAVTLA